MDNYNNPTLTIESSKVEPGKCTWRSPSNIALIKYWGKYGNQLPKNPSISFTLDKAFTETSLEYTPRVGPQEEISLQFFFDGKSNDAFAKRIKKYLAGLLGIFPFIRQLDFTIRSTNSFPHSAGIASSASSMSALALCLCSLEHTLFESLPDDSAYRKKASFIARLGSGSACRSVYDKLSFWGKFSQVPESSDLYAVPYVKNVHPVFLTFRDDILIVSSEEKAVSSSIGHSLMDEHPFGENRFLQARQRMTTLLDCLKSGDVEAAGKTIEEEALGLHALMMLSNPYYILLKPNTLHLIEEIMRFRREEKVPLYFTMDAGPNVHLLYPESFAERVSSFTENRLRPFVVDILKDQVGEGPLQL